MKILFATTNKAKVRYYTRKLKDMGIDIITLSDLNITLDVDENGSNPVENAVIKAKAYASASGLPTISLDDGLFFDNLSDDLQPGTHVRRVNGSVLDDDSMIEHYVNLVNRYGTHGQLSGYFLKGIAISYDGQLYTFEKKAPRIFTNQRSSILDEGYPLASIQIIPGVNKFKSELTLEEEILTMDFEQQDIFTFIFDTIRRLTQY